MQSFLPGQKAECPDQDRSTENAREGLGIKVKQKNDAQGEQQIRADPVSAGRQQIVEQDSTGKKQR